MNKEHKNIIIALILIPLLSGCIKENRDGCPSYLFIDLSQVDTTKIERVSLFIEENGGKIIENLTFDKPSIPLTYEMGIRKGDYKIHFWGNILNKSNLDPNNGSITLIHGCDSDRLFFHTADTDANGEISHHTVLPEKNYMNIKLFLKGIKNGEKLFANIISESNGYQLDGNVILEQTIIRSEYSDSCSFNIIRQEDYKNLKLVMKKNSEEITIPIGELILKEPPPYFPENLCDITLRIDYSASRITIEADGWKKIFEDFLQIF